MNKPNNKKQCGGCKYFRKNKYVDSNGNMFCICDADLRTNSNCTCEYWKGKKYTKDDRKKLKQKFKQFVKKQKNIPAEYVDIINKNFWDLI